MILIVGPPGAGKSLQARKLESDLKLRWLSMGHLLRNNLDTSIQDKLDNGELVDDSITQDILIKELEQTPLETTVLLDGHPRRASQATWLVEYLTTSQRSIKAVVHLQVPLGTIMDRLLARGRADDRPDVIKARYEQYENEIIPMVEELRSQGVTILEIDGSQEVDDVHETIMQSLKGII